MRNLNSQVFYNSFICPLEGLENLIRENNYSRAAEVLLFICNNFLDEDWKPFPDFSNVVLYTSVPITLWNLRNNLINPQLSNDHLIEAIAPLRKLAHVFNFIDCAFHFKSHKAQQFHQEVQLNNLLCSTGLFSKWGSVQDCHGNQHIIADKKSPAPLLPSPEYRILMEVLESLGNTASVRNFLIELFDDLNPIEKNSDKMATLKGDIEDLFLLGKIESVVEMSNFYKARYQELIEQDKQEKDLEEEACIENVP
jgi:hypothetical protein